MDTFTFVEKENTLVVHENCFINKMEIFKILSHVMEVRNKTWVGACHGLEMFGRQMQHNYQKNRVI